MTKGEKCVSYKIYKTNLLLEMTRKINSYEEQRKL